MNRVVRSSESWLNSGRDVVDAINALPIMDVAEKLGVVVTRRKALCVSPQHNEKTPSLSFHPQKNVWKCFGCGRAGDSIKLVMERYEIDFKTALEWFAVNFGIRGTGRRGSKSLRLAMQKARRIDSTNTPNAIIRDIEARPADTELFTWFINKCGPISSPEGKEYLTSHAISDAAAARFKVKELKDPIRARDALVREWGHERVLTSGLAYGSNGKVETLIWKSYCILFPYWHENIVIQIQARMFTGDRKYLNPVGIRRELFNYDALQTLKNGQTIHICEGVPDTLAMESIGRTSVGVPGTASFKKDWVELFLPFKVVLIPDADEAGRRFATNCRTMFAQRGKGIDVVFVPDNMDIAEYLAGQIGSTK